MERRTLTTLGQLRVGDRFHYPGGTRIYQVTAQMRTSSSVNKPTVDGGFDNKYDEMVRNTKQVIFLRHTRPETGERCLFKDLKPGDVFHLPNNIINEYIIQDGGWAYPTNGHGMLELKPSDPVVFVRKHI